MKVRLSKNGSKFVRKVEIDLYAKHRIKYLLRNRLMMITINQILLDNLIKL